MIKFVLLINKQGQTRLAKYYFDTTVEERMALEGELIRKCLSRTEKQVCSLFCSRKQIHSAHLWIMANTE